MIIVYRVYGRAIDSFVVVENDTTKTQNKFYNITEFAVKEVLSLVDSSVKITPAIPVSKFKQLK